MVRGLFKGGAYFIQLKPDSAGTIQGQEEFKEIRHFLVVGPAKSGSSMKAQRKLNIITCKQNVDLLAHTKYMQNISHVLKLGGSLDKKKP